MIIEALLITDSSINIIVEIVLTPKQANGRQVVDSPTAANPPPRRASTVTAAAVAAPSRPPPAGSSAVVARAGMPGVGGSTGGADLAPKRPEELGVCR